MKKSSLFGAGLAALVLVSGCKARDIELSSDLSDISETNTDKAFIAAYSSDGGAEGTAAAADIIEKRLKAVCDGDFTVSADGSSITIELPDKTDSEAEELLKNIDKTALLTFRMGWSGDIPEGGSYEDLELVLTGAEVDNAAAFYNSVDYQFAVELKLDEKGAEAFKAATRAAFDKSLDNGEYGYISIWLDSEEICAPMVSSVIENGMCVISGGFDTDSAVRLADLINFGALPVNLTRSYAE